MALFLEMSGLLAFFRGNRAPMGMARVQMALLEAAPDLLHPVAFADAAAGLRLVPARPLAALLAAARAGGAADDAAFQALRAALQAALAAAPPAPLAPGDRILLAGLSNPAELLRLRPLQRAGALVCTLFYDAIPLSHPEHVPPQTVQDFAWGFGLSCLMADRVAAISAHSARAFAQWQHRFLPALELPVAVMPLDAPFPAAPAGALPAPLHDGRPFVLCVATLESRKDHALLLRAWAALVARHGADAVPDLVLAGRAGWGAEAALALLPALGAKVHWLPGLGDAAVAALYRGCLFTIFNSVEEGWGLPVTEALAHGKAVLAPDLPALREAGGEAALFFPPGDEAALAALAWSLLTHPGRRAVRRAPLRPWRAVAEGLARALLAPAPPAPDPLARAALPLARRLPFAPPTGAALPGPEALLPFLLREGEGWAVAEPGGVWLVQAPAGAAPAVLRLPLPAAMARPRLFLEVEAPPAPVVLRLRAGDGPWHALPLEPSADRIVALDLPGGPCAVEFDARDSAPPLGAETRRLNARLRAMMACDADDHATQARFFLEHPRCRFFSS